MNPELYLSEAIAAASLVLAVLVALYTLWLPAVSQAMRIEPHADRDDRGPQITRVLEAIRTKALPLTGATIVAAVVLAPRTVQIMLEPFVSDSTMVYNDVKALFVLTWALLLILVIVSGVQLIELFKVLMRLRAPNS